MSSAVAIERSAGTPPGPPVPPAASPGTGGAGAGAPALLVSAPTVVMWLVLGAAFVALFNHWFYVQHHLSMGRFADWGHAYFVPLVSVYVLWQRREALALARVRVCWPGLGVMAAGIAMYLVFIAGYNNHMAQGWAMLVTLFGLLLLMLGPEVMRTAWLGVAYLVFAVAISDPVMQQVTTRLQLIASQGAYVLLNVVGITTDISGNVLTVFTSDGERLPLNVAEACSGMRQLISFLALGAAVALVALPWWWQRVVLVAMAVPVALAVNVVRVAALGVASLWNPELSRGEAHTFIGTVLLVPAFVLYMGIVWALKRAIREVPAEGGAA